MNGLSTCSGIDSASDLRKHSRVYPVITIHSPEDIRKAQDYSGIKISLVEETFFLFHLGTLFVDSSGFGSPDELAIQFPEALRRTKKILEIAKSHNAPLKAILSGIGQFQVYIAFFANIDFSEEIDHYVN